MHSPLTEGETGPARTERFPDDAAAALTEALLTADKPYTTIPN